MRFTITTLIGMLNSLVILAACNGGVDYGDAVNAANSGSAGEAGSAGSAGEAGSAGSAGSDAGTDSNSNVCDPGSSKACKCGEESGTKKCKDDGSGYGECICGSDAGVCIPGEYKITGCCGNGVGTQQCNDDGSGWGECLYCEQSDAGSIKCGQYDVGSIVTSPCCPDGTNGKQVCQVNGVMSECMDCPPPAAHTHYHDKDGDGAGDHNDKIVDANANPPAGYVNVDGDCDDSNASVVPGSIRSCVCAGGGNGTQQCVSGAWTSCTGCQSQYTYFRDADGDGLGDPANKLINTSPTPPAGYVTNANDCDDSNSAVGSSGSRACVGANNCSGTQQCVSGVYGACICGQMYTYHGDKDADGYVSETDIVTISSSTPPAGYKVKTLINGGDCNDGDPAVHPSAVEACDGKDNNCDGVVDEGCQDGGETMDMVTIEFTDNTDWSVPVIKGRWNGRPEIQENGGTTDWYAFTGCTKPSAHAVTCTFTVPHIAISSLVFQVNLGSNRYWGDASGNAPAPCKTPTEMSSIYQSSVTLIGTLTLKVNGVLQPFRMCSNGTPKQSTCASCCAASGSMPYYNGMNGECQ